MPRRARSTWPPTVTSPGAVIRPWPRKNCPPLPVNRSTATLSSQSSVASTRIRRATGAQSGCTDAAPAMPGMRCASASRLAARIIILDGTQPQYGHSPPTSRSSTPATDRPAAASRSAASSPPGPMPTTTTSTSCSVKPASPWGAWAADPRVWQGGIPSGIAAAGRSFPTTWPAKTRPGRGASMTSERGSDARLAGPPLTERRAEEQVHGICFKTGPPAQVGRRAGVAGL